MVSWQLRQDNMRRLTQEEKNVFEKALLQTNGVNAHLFDIMSWTFFPRWRFWLFVDSLTSGMHWWAAYEKAKNTKKNNETNRHIGD